jgi:hypothetical protein
MRDDKLLK